MIVAEQKPIREILEMLPAGKSVLVAGCDTCVTICLAGGKKETRILSAALAMAAQGLGRVTGVSVERQCDREFIEEIAAAAAEHDLILSLACGAGVQMMADRFPDKPVLPGLNTLFVGSNEGAGYWLERCLGCGDCVLDLTAGICPRTRCSKGLMNGPCGGSENGKCEVDPQHLDCGWNLIYQRLKSMNRLDSLMAIQPPQDWSKSHDGGPRKLIREEVTP